MLEIFFSRPNKLLHRIIESFQEFGFRPFTLSCKIEDVKHDLRKKLNSLQTAAQLVEYVVSEMDNLQWVRTSKRTKNVSPTMTNGIFHASRIGPTIFKIRCFFTFSTIIHSSNEALNKSCARVSVSLCVWVCAHANVNRSHECVHTGNGIHLKRTCNQTRYKRWQMTV